MRSTTRRRKTLIITSKITKRTTRWPNLLWTWLKTTTKATRKNGKLISHFNQFQNQLTPFAVTFFCSISGAHSLSIRTSSTLCRSIPSGTVCVFWTELTAFDLIQVITRVAWHCKRIKVGLTIPCQLIPLFTVCKRDQRQTDKKSSIHSLRNLTFLIGGLTSKDYGIVSLFNL